MKRMRPKWGITNKRRREIIMKNWENNLKKRHPFKLNMIRRNKSFRKKMRDLDKAIMKSREKRINFSMILKLLKSRRQMLSRSMLRNSWRQKVNWRKYKRNTQYWKRIILISLLKLQRSLKDYLKNIKSWSQTIPECRLWRTNRLNSQIKAKQIFRKNSSRSPESSKWS